MSKVVEALRSEITRLSRKEIRLAVSPMARGVASLRRSVQDLNKRMAAVERQVKHLSAGAASGKSSAEIARMQTEGARMSPYLMKKVRKRLGISQGELAALVGVSAPAVASWEQGRAKPRAESRAAVIALRNMTPTEASEALRSKKTRRRKRR
ncbi:helix-turn-helix domain-containing protein [Candidatus Sumerlaeota bacterium]|nr:helix-turn-helix domain-containing protein [Candidatus Sumerlaeota bacterium]